MDERPITTQLESDVCIVGGGPAGMMLAYLLARQGIAVTVLEAQKDFNRKFRGDTLHTGILENLATLGLIDKVNALPHTKIQQMVTVANGERIVTGDLGKLNRPYPYMMMVAQPLILQLLADEAAQYPNFRLIMGASAQELVTTADDVVQGVRYRQGREWGEVKAHLTVGCDGRSSKLRKLGGFTLRPTTNPMEALWISIPKSADEQHLSGNQFGIEEGFITHERVDAWHIALPMPQGGYKQLKDQGFDNFRALLHRAKPHMQNRIDEHIQSWQNVAVLKVQGGRVNRWYKNGLLLIGDAAHVMTPIMGVGINYAFQDAIAAANILTQPLQKRDVGLEHLAKVQKRRIRPVTIIQRIQARAQSTLTVPSLTGEQTSGIHRSPIQRIPFLGQFGLRTIALGIRPEKVRLSS